MHQALGHLPVFLSQRNTGRNAALPFIVGAAADGTHLVDQYGSPRFLVNEDCWAILANGGAFNSGDYRATYDTYFAQRGAQGYNAVEVTWCSYDVPFSSFVNNDGSDWDGVFPFATSMDPTTAPVAAFWTRRDYFLDTARAHGFTVIMNVTTTALGLSPGPPQVSWSTAQWQAFGTFLGNRYKNVPNLMWIFGDDYFGTIDSNLSACLTSLRATGDTHLASVQVYQESTSRLDISTLTKDPLAFSVHAQFDWVYTYNVSYDGVEKSQAYTPTGSDDVQHVIPPIWGDGHYLASSVDATTTDTRLHRQMVWWALSSGACGFSSGDNDIWGWGSSSAAQVTGKSYYTQTIPAIVRSFASLPGWWQLAPDTSSVLVTAGRGTHASAIESGGGGTYYTVNTDNYVTASRTPDAGSGSSLAVIYCAQAMNITIDQTKMRAGYTATWVDPASGATFASATGSTYNAATARGSNSAGDPDWVLILRG